MKVAVIGAGRKRNGIGEFIAKYLHANGATVSCVLGSTTGSSQTAAARLGTYGIRAKAYTDFSEMIRDAGPDAVAIASPIPTHGEYIERCIQAGVHVFCEKPFLS
ncbi:MAG TPA: Gfo/Idh/MocA family oxidoreductase, partial [Deltaproteobacteria bacterium]|nr:Gfo/Idh/MocA family oxidoreductase [Deltaproteobacteria bacterium]